MGKIFCVMGKSASGKDTIYENLLKDQDLQLQRVIPYTTRPIRDHEIEGREYHFVTEEEVLKLEAAGIIVEMREYHTVYGPWKYFTVDDGGFDLAEQNYLIIGTVEGYVKIRDYFGADKVRPIYIEVEDGDRLIRAIAREKKQDVPKYEEMCRRFLADAKDFSKENLLAAGITDSFYNVTLENTIREIKDFIQEEIAE